MIRFIDLRGQINDDEDKPPEERECDFAFFDTVTATFCRIGDFQHWRNRAEFLWCIRSDDAWSKQEERFVRKLPEWVPWGIC